MSRTPIGQKLRFAVLRRDNFTCQYCGQRAPAVVLQVDHVRAVVNGGSGSTENLVTACSACNMGKAAGEVPIRWSQQRQLLQAARGLPLRAEEREGEWLEDVVDNIFAAFHALGVESLLFDVASVPGITFRQWCSYCIRHLANEIGDWKNSSECSEAYDRHVSDVVLAMRDAWAASSYRTSASTRGN